MATEGTYFQIKPLIKYALDKGLTVFLHSHPGAGKSTMAQEIATETDRRMIDIRLAQWETADLAGTTFPDPATKRLAWYPPFWFPEKDDRVFLFLDEINAGVTKLQQSVAYQITLDKRVGPGVFPEGTPVMAAGNLEEDNAITTTLSSALNNRCAHFILKIDANTWIKWAEADGLPAEWLAYISFKREAGLYDNNGGHAFPTPRSIAMAAKINGELSATDRRKLVAACIGEAAAAEFHAFSTIYAKIDLVKILEKGVMPNLSNAEPSFLYALCFSSASYLRALPMDKIEKTAKNAIKLVTAINQPDFQTIFFQNVCAKKGIFDIFHKIPEFAALAPRLTALYLDTESA